ncbi:hypothetical protein ACYQB3_001618 [Campylobacter upsaliensis]|nr:hypothetical protein [Campylobacter upsaliensis]EHV9439787.1 hypothetical protein [Campylobacter upsaliensis]ELW3222262.1 hypothetical protein [Campylobacter upsaliensis]
MYEMERAKVRILRETRGAFSDESLEAFFNFLIDNEIKRDYAEVADFVENAFRIYLTKGERKEVRREGLFYIIISLIYRVRGMGVCFSFSSDFIKIKNKNEVKNKLQELGVDVENLKLRTDIDRILYVLLQEKE